MNNTRKHNSVANLELGFKRFVKTAREALYAVNVERAAFVTDDRGIAVHWVRLFGNYTLNGIDLGCCFVVFKLRADLKKLIQ